MICAADIFRFMEKYSESTMQSVLTLMQALSDANRLRTLIALQPGELCVCQIIALLNLAPSTVSKHLSILKTARLVDCRKQGRWRYYRLAREYPSPAAGGILDLLFRELDRANQIHEDRQRLQAINSENLETTCRSILADHP